MPATGHGIDGVLGVQNHRHGELGSVWSQEVIHADILMLHCEMEAYKDAWGLVLSSATKGSGWGPLQPYSIAQQCCPQLTSYVNVPDLDTTPILPGV